MNHGISKNDHSKGDTAGESQVTSTNKAAVSICQPTDYKDACLESLQPARSNVTDPRELLKVGFEFTRDKLAEVMDHSTTLKEAEKDPIAKQALSICNDMMESAMDHLQQSFEKMGVFDITNLDDLMSDLQTWLSSVITYQGTCFDGFENVTSPAAPKIKEALNNTMKFSSNALVMVQQVSEIFKSLSVPGFNTRRLLQENDGELPVWLDSARLKLLVDETTKPNLVIAKDGSGDYKTFTEAIKTLPTESMTPFVVHVKAGVYPEKVLIPINIWNITWIGEGATTRDESYLPVKADFASYLGRTWKPYSTVIYMQSFISDVINREGWTPRMGSFGTTTCFFAVAEFDNRGPGSDTSRRITWQGIKQLSPTQALEFTGEKFRVA
ncbi:hypothetical protein SAY87_010502 [Trapa incisa]|uniref:Pectinesterase inhibitor domain-containing protein n=1 Tax=Trapa incisa TaxID=236973 RepID=A0AAN7JI76_9MYRT|nr:hypothetical protein SAY87_010502 [Trapa incisa]